ncbi:MAG: hypothetical protein JSV19_06295 [Phycisphaerales bacterium]|nr:MAG: hypothetical protein JSV19_06295 [Phycisphaerales bacterium]
MTALKRQVRRTQQRLWANRWFALLAWTTTVSVGVFAAVVILVKMFGWAAPLGWIALGLVGAGVVVASILSLTCRAGKVTAAAALDEAAGLRERVSSGLYCEQSGDPYAQAVVVDAERISGSLSVRRHIPLRAPQPLVYAGTAAIVAGILLLMPSGWIERSQAESDAQEQERIERRNVAVKKRIDLVKKQAKVNTALKDNPAMKDLVAGLENLAKEPFANPDARRHEAVKKIDSAADALKKQRAGEKFDKVGEMKKMLRGLKTQGETGTPAQKLSEALAKGDFKAANEAIKAMQQQLASMKSAENAEAAQKLQEQLNRLAEQLDKAASTAQLEKKLEQAGLSKEDIKKMMDQLAKGDMSELEKQLAKRGLSQPQIDSLMKQMAKRAQACQACRNMSGALSQAAGAMQQGQMSDASSGLESARDELSELEMLEQEMNQLESAIASLEDAKGDMKPCPACDGTGMCGGRPCSMCQGGDMRKGFGMGPLGQGRGGLAPEEETSIAFKAERSKVYTGPGRIIGQFLIEGEQVKGEASSELAEIISAEERNATDAINRDRIPRQYQRSVKEYFSRVQKLLGNGSATTDDEPETGGESDRDTADDGDSRS